MQDKKINNKKYSEIVAEEFNQWQQKGRAESMQEEHIIAVEAAIKEMPLSNGLKVLDIGCGNGYAVRLIATKIMPDGLATGVDIAENMIITATEKSKHFKNTNFRKADFLNLPFEKDSFDIVLSVESIYYAEDFSKALQNVYKILKPSGIFYCVTYFFKEHYNSEVWADHVPLKMHYLSENEYKEAFKEVGFNNIKVKRVYDHRPVDTESFTPRWGYDTADELINFKRNIGALLVIGSKTN